MFIFAMLRASYSQTMQAFGGEAGFQRFRVLHREN
jgi:hypothetical protein